MTLEEFAKQLETTGFPVAFYEFPKEEPHDPPFLCYIPLPTQQFSADGIVYFSSIKVQVELYTLKKNIEAEQKLERALSSFYFEKDEGYLEDEKIYMVTYQLTI